MALSGGNNLATTLFLNASPYRAIFHPYRPQVQDHIGATTILTRGDIIIETGDVLYPVEFKKTASPSVGASRQFATLEKLGKTVGHGAVLCFVEHDIPLSGSVTAVPVGYL